MRDQTIKLMALIKKGKTCNEICSILNISNKQLFNNLTNLRNKGLYYKQKCYSNGEIIYRPITSLNEIKNIHNSNNTIITTHYENLIKCLVISDLHFGNKLERLDLLDRAFNYCIKNNIHIILCCGDMIDGSYTQGEQNITDIYQQIEHFVKDYPFDKNIITFGVAGDHDLTGLNNGAQDIISILKSYRHDIVIGDYTNSWIHIKNDQVHLFHHTYSGMIKTDESSIVFHGHTHKFMVETKNLANKIQLNVAVPTLSNIMQDYPSALELSLLFKCGYIYYAYIKQIFFGEQDYTLNEMKYSILKEENIKSGNIYNEEPVKTILQKKI